MEKAVEKLRGYLEVKISGGNPERFLNNCSKRGIVLTDCRAVTEIELNCTIPRRYLQAAIGCANKSECELKILRRRGASFTIGKVRRRYFLLSGLFAVLLLLGLSSIHIWDIDVVGNQAVSRAEILNVLEEFGVSIGANWTEFDNDMIRSQVLSKLPELSFISVNVHGSRATVIVRERQAVPEIDILGAKGDVIAAKNGVIIKINAFRGSPLVRCGNAVLAGDVLISGSVPGISETNELRAFGEVKAHTYYEMTAAEHLETQVKVPTGRKARNFAVIIGETRLNIYRNTGIYRDDCDTIYNIWKAEIKGLFTLPIALVRETRAQYELMPATKDTAEAETRLKDILLAQLSSEIAEYGVIESYDFAVTEDNSVLKVTLRAACVEDIGVNSPANK